jgi:hypothetical protein
MWCIKEMERSIGSPVYGAADEGRNQWFVDELHSMLVGSKEATIIGGDFNLVRF